MSAASCFSCKASRRTLREILTLAPNTKTIAVTEPEARELAVRAVGLGAADFYHRPIVAREYCRSSRAAHFAFASSSRRTGRLRAQTGATALEGIIDASDAMWSLCHVIEKVALTNATTLILGEKGTGTELLARALHRLSSRAQQPFVAINRAGIPDTLLESELFAYDEGRLDRRRQAHRGQARSREQRHSVSE